MTQATIQITAQGLATLQEPEPARPWLVLQIEWEGDGQNQERRCKSAEALDSFTNPAEAALFLGYMVLHSGLGDNIEFQLRFKS
jgi:hypothetical protein